MSDLVLEIEREFDAPVEKVYEAWTSSENLTKWWGPENTETIECEVDVREGGKWSAAMRSQEGDVYRHDGVYQRIEPNKLLVFTWAWYNEGQRGHETTVTITFDQAGSKTRMKLHQATFADKTQCERHNEGWSSSFVCLEQAIG